MATDIYLVREGSGLAAADPFSMETIEGLGRGEMVLCKLSRPRNPGHHRKFFALLGVAFRAQSRYPTLDHLLEAVKIGIGHYDVVNVRSTPALLEAIKDALGIYQIILPSLPPLISIPLIQPRSISFAKMSQESFEQFYDAAVLYVLTEILPGVERADIEAQVLEILG